MKPQNKADIRKKSIHFGLLFLVLVSYTLVPAYFFVWASLAQKRNFIENLQAYRQLRNKQLLLKEKMDSLYIQLNYVDAGRINHYLPLEKSIAENKFAIISLIGIDSADHFSAYTHIIHHINDHLFLRDSIVQTTGAENMLKSELFSCMAKTKNIRTSIFKQTRITNTQ